MSKYGVKLSTLALAGLSIFAVSSANAIEKDTGAMAMTAQVSGLVQVDTSYHLSNDNDKLKQNFKNGEEIRRAKLSIYGEAGDWSYKVGLEKSEGQNSLGLNIDDIYATYNGFSSNVSFSFGYMCPLFGLENSSSSAFSNFLESSYVGDVFSTSSEKAVQLRGHTDSFTFGVTGFLPAKRNVDPAAGEGSEMLYGASARVTFSPMHETAKAYHVGASALYSNFNAQDNVDNSEYVNVETFTMGPRHFGVKGLKYRGLDYPSKLGKDKFNVDSQLFLGGEAAMVKGPFSGQIEFVYSNLKNKSIKATSEASAFNADMKAEDAFWGANAEVAYVLTGESRDYNFASARIDGLTPSNSYGAFEVAARVDYLDMGLSDNNLAKGTAYFDLGGSYSGLYANDELVNDLASSSAWNTWKVSLAGTWYANEFASVKVNGIYASLPEAMSTAIYSAKDKTIYGAGLRAQLSW